MIKMARVGIPRALLYYQYHPMWETFLRELGAEVIVSPETTQITLSEGSSRVVADTCLPVKVFMGHVLSLAGQCDYVFIPAIRSVKRRVYNCSKFLGLPDMTRAVISESPPILDIEVDVNKGRLQLYQSIYKLARHFTRNPLRIRQAAIAAWRAYLDYQRPMCCHGLNTPEAMERISGRPKTKPKTGPNHSLSPQATIAIIGHLYLLYDDLISYRLIRRLLRSDIEVLTPKMLSPEVLQSATVKAVGKAHWTYEDEVVGAGVHYLSQNVDGVIGLTAFGCGPDSMMMEIVRSQARLKNTPFLCLSLDEHQSEAGVITRLEAFLDMISRRSGGDASRAYSSR